jgi:hypothetical protein
MIDYAIYNSLGKFISAGTAEAVNETALQAGHNIHYGLVNPTQEYFDTDTQAVVQMDPQPSLYHQFDYTSKTWVLNLEYASQIALAQRQRLLADSDWTDTVSAQARLGTQYATWQSYRQALRDITAQSGYPTTIEWPTVP